MSLHNIHCVWLKTLQLTLAEEYNSIPLSVLTPVGGRQERHMACKKKSAQIIPEGSLLGTQPTQE